MSIFVIIAMVLGAGLFYGGYLTGRQSCANHMNVSNIPQVNFDTSEPKHKKVQPSLPEHDREKFDRMVREINSMDDTQTFGRNLREQTIRQNVRP